MTSTELRQVLIVGTGLVGTSLALALRRRDIRVLLYDRDPAVMQRASALDAGRILGTDDTPSDVCVVAVPPASVTSVLVEAQQQRCADVYTDVASTKQHIIADVAKMGGTLQSYVPGHPMAGREQSGPDAARSDLFTGRPWALCDLPENHSEAFARVAALVYSSGGHPRPVHPMRHDQIVAAVSHAPHVIASAVAATLSDADETTLSLTGRGIQDVTRIAAGDRRLWTDILGTNAGAVADVLDTVIGELATAAQSLRGTGPSGLDAVTDLLSRGCTGQHRLAAINNISTEHVDIRSTD